MTTTISFPGLGIPEFTMKRTAFELFGSLGVQWYGIIITCGIILSFIYCAYRAKQEGIKFDDLLDIAIFTILFSVIGARVGYVLFSIENYLVYLEKDGFFGMLKEMVNIRGGGLQIYGAIIVGAVTIFIVCRIKKIKPLKMLDAVAPAVMIGQFIGRWGNFVNGEAHGGVIEKDSLLYFIRMTVNGSAGVHPTFLYESVWNILGFILINIFYKKKKFDGQIVLMYLSWYGFGRMFIETLRTDSLYIWNTGIRISVAIGFICFVGGVALLIYGFVKTTKKAENVDYTPAYARISHYGEGETDADTKEEVKEDTKSEGEATEGEKETDEVGTEEAPNVTAEDKDEIEKKLNELLNANGINENNDNEEK